MDDFIIILLTDTSIIPTSRKMEFVNETLNVIKLNNSTTFANGKPSIQFGIFDKRKKNNVTNKRNRPDKNQLDREELYVEERLERRQNNIIFSGETAGIFKRYESVFGSYSKRGKRIIRTYQ